jgi:hypothetical protein
MVLWLIPAVAFAVGALATSAEPAVVLWGITGVFLLGLIIHLLLGPTCVCHVQTAVQTEKLPSLKRLRKARKILNQLKPLIAAVQGELPAQELAVRSPGEPAITESPPESLVEPIPSENAAGPDKPSTGTT